MRRPLIANLGNYKGLGRMLHSFRSKQTTHDSTSQIGAIFDILIPTPRWNRNVNANLPKTRADADTKIRGTRWMLQSLRDYKPHDSATQHLIPTRHYPRLGWMCRLFKANIEVASAFRDERFHVTLKKNSGRSQIIVYPESVGVEDFWPSEKYATAF